MCVCVVLIISAVVHCLCVCALFMVWQLYWSVHVHLMTRCLSNYIAVCACVDHVFTESIM